MSDYEKQMEEQAKALWATVRKTSPSVAFSVSWEYDNDHEWDGEGEGPLTYGHEPHVFTVTAKAIQGGRMVEGHSYLGGSYIENGCEPCPMINGYLPQMIDEALADLKAEILKLNK